MPDLRPEILDYVKNMPPSSHAIFLYESEAEKDTVLFTYVQDRLRRGELVSYHVHEGSVEEVERAMTAFGIDVGMWKRQGATRGLEV